MNVEILGLWSQDIFHNNLKRKHFIHFQKGMKENICNGHLLSPAGSHGSIAGSRAIRQWEKREWEVLDSNLGSQWRESRWGSALPGNWSGGTDQGIVGLLFPSPLISLLLDSASLIWGHNCPLSCSPFPSPSIFHYHFSEFLPYLLHMYGDTLERAQALKCMCSF